MNTDEKPCPKCVNGTVSCRRCGGSGNPPRGPSGPMDLYEQHTDKCANCVGVGTLSCPKCGGVCVVPA